MSDPAASVYPLTSKLRKRQPEAVAGQNPVAVVHEWLSTKAGSEKVTECIIKLMQNVEVYSTVDFMSPRDRKATMGERSGHTTFIQKLPFARRHFRYYLPLFPWAVRTHKLADYPVVISSSHAFAHGVKTHGEQLHISYCHTPMRYIWDMQDLYLRANDLDRGVIGFFGRMFSNFLRRWDAKVSKNVDYYISNSHFTAKRIKKYYGRDAHVIYPPVEIERFDPCDEKEEYYVTASRLVCYKKVELVAEAFAKMPDKKLIIIGDGKRKARIEKIATPNIELLSHLEHDKFHHYLRKAKGFVFAGKEDFGITLVDAQACGTPVIAYNDGGAAEIVQKGKTGVLFDEQSADSIVQAINNFEEKHDGHFPADVIRANAERFSLERFNEEMLSFVNKCIREKFAL